MQQILLVPGGLKYPKAAIPTEWSLLYFYLKLTRFFILLLKTFFNYKQVLQRNHAASELRVKGDMYPYCVVGKLGHFGMDCA